MSTELEPVPGEWYLHREQNRLFVVVDVDTGEGFVEIQLTDGSPRQLDLAAWYEMHLEPSAEPDDWLGSDIHLTTEEHDATLVSDEPDRLPDAG